MKRVLFILILSVVGIVATFYDAYWGLLLYTWFSFASPLELTYGMLAGSRISLVVGGLVVICTLYQRRVLMYSHFLSYLMIAYLVASFFSLAAQLQFSLGTILDLLELPAKLVLIALLTPVLLTSLTRLRYFIATIAVSGGALGFYYGVFGLFAGSKQIFGPGRIGDNNGYAVFLAALLPLVFFSMRYVQLFHLSIFRGLLITSLLIGNSIALILTYSRGGFLAGASVLVLILLKVRSVWSRVFAWGLVLPTLIFVCWTIFNVDTGLVEIPEGEISDSPVASILDGYVLRLQTLRRDIESESSAGGRLHFWQVAWLMFRSNPLFGVGLKQYSTQYPKYDFSDGEFGDVRASHNTHLLVLSELGGCGFLVYLGLLGGIFWSGVRAKRQAAERLSAEEYEECSSYVAMVRISLFGYLLGGTFVNVPYQEIFWALLSISIALDRLTLAPLEGSSAPKPL